MASDRTNRTYDHRLIQLVQETGDAAIATRLGVPKSTVSGWIRRSPRDVVSASGLDESAAVLQIPVARLERRVHRLAAMLRILFALVRILQPDLTRLRVPNGSDMRRLLRAAKGCELDDQSSCPAFSPQGLTPDEVSVIGLMVTSPDYRHVPTGRLALLAQRLGNVIASPSTWYRLVRERG